jgi:2-polyprenyl-6-methoxyphenol hydroxylase-like FAD-dependent oxidoreductase
MLLPQPDTQHKILIVGAGIGGLATALALHPNGFTNIHIFETASTLTAMGVGINVLPSAVLILRNLGLLKHLRRWASRLKKETCTTAMVTSS